LDNFIRWRYHCSIRLCSTSWCLQCRCACKPLFHAWW